MNVSKTLKEYIEETIREKVAQKAQEKREKDEEKFDKVRYKLDDLYTEHIRKAREILEDAGLNPDKYGYYEFSPAVAKVPNYVLPYCGPRRADIYKNVQDIIIRIELDEIPKNEIKSYIDNYEIMMDED